MRFKVVGYPAEDAEVPGAGDATIFSASWVSVVPDDDEAFEFVLNSGAEFVWDDSSWDYCPPSSYLVVVSDGKARFVRLS